jgi:hypothetical protein
MPHIAAAKHPTLGNVARCDARCAGAADRSRACASCWRCPRAAGEGDGCSNRAMAARSEIGSRGSRPLPPGVHEATQILMTTNLQPTLSGDALGVLADAAARAEETLELASRHLDSSLVDVLEILGFDESYVSAKGSYIYDQAGRAYLDLHTGEGFASLGHNHPDVREVLEATLAADLLDGVQIHYSPWRSASGCRRAWTPCSSRAPAPRRSTRR